MHLTLCKVAMTDLCTSLAALGSFFATTYCASRGQAGTKRILCQALPRQFVLLTGHARATILLSQAVAGPRPGRHPVACQHTLPAVCSCWRLPVLGLDGALHLRACLQTGKPLSCPPCASSSAPPGSHR